MNSTTSSKRNEENGSEANPSQKENSPNRQKWAFWKRAAAIALSVGSLSLLSACGGMATPIGRDADASTDSDVPTDVHRPDSSADSDVSDASDAGPEAFDGDMADAEIYDGDVIDADEEEEPACHIDNEAEITCDSGPSTGTLFRGEMLLFENIGIWVDSIEPDEGTAGRITITILDSDCNPIMEEVDVYAGRPVRINHPLLDNPIYILFGEVHGEGTRASSEATVWSANCAEPTLPEGFVFPESCGGDTDVVTMQLEEGEVFIHPDYMIVRVTLSQAVEAASEGEPCAISDKEVQIEVTTRDFEPVTLVTLREGESMIAASLGSPFCLAVSVGEIFEDVAPAVCPPDGGECTCAISNEKVELTVGLVGPSS